MLTNILKRLILNKATGYDQMSPKIVKEISVTLIELLKYAFIYKIFPDEMKKGEIADLLKKKDDKNVSIFTVFEKVFESIMAEKRIEHFKNIFNDMLCAYYLIHGNMLLIKIILLEL